MENKEHSFVLKEDGKIYWIEDMPKQLDLKTLRKNYVYNDYKFFSGYSDGDIRKQYESEVKSAIDNAVEVSNQKEVECALGNKFTVNEVYSLQCRVEVAINSKGLQHHAHVTFDSPLVEEQRETQDAELMLLEIIAICRAHADDGHFDHEGAKANAMDFINKKYRITPKQ
jgi:hypothetical protein